MTTEGKMRGPSEWGEHPDRKRAKPQPTRAAGRGKRGLQIGDAVDVVSSPTVVIARTPQANGLVSSETATSAIKDILSAHTGSQLTTTEIFALLNEQIENARITLGKTGALLGAMVTSGDISRERISVEGGKQKTTWAIVEKAEETKKTHPVREWFRARFGRQEPIRTVESHEVISVTEPSSVVGEQRSENKNAPSVSEPIVIANFASAEKASQTLPAPIVPSPRLPMKEESIAPVRSEIEPDVIEQTQLLKPENLASGFSETKKSAQSFKIGPDRLPWLTEERDVNLVEVTIAGSGEKFNLGSVIKGNKDLLAAAKNLDPRGKAIADNLFYSHLPRFLIERKGFKPIMHPVTKEPIYSVGNRAGQRVYFMRFNGQPEKHNSNGNAGEQLPTILRVAVCDKADQDDLVLKHFAQKYHK